MLFTFSRSIYPLKHTEVELEFFNQTNNCSPEVHVKIRQLGIENVISSCVISKEPLNANCTAKRLLSDVKLDSVCIDTENAIWLLSLYGKQTWFSVVQIELRNETLRV
ncbi:MAG: hypothetical protein QXI54_05075 [Archaeoglobaceae archaeon]